MRESTSLLHNMSVPPKSTVRYTGLTGITQKAGPAEAGVASSNDNSGPHYGQAIRFELPPTLLVSTPTQLLDWLRVPYDESTHATAARHLQNLINQRAAELPLPDGCAVVKGLQAQPTIWGDPLAAMAIITKSTDTVWLRTKTPALSNLMQRRCVSLLVPPPFVARLTECIR